MDLGGSFGFRSQVYDLLKVVCCHVATNGNKMMQINVGGGEGRAATTLEGAVSLRSKGN